MLRAATIVLALQLALQDTCCIASVRESVVKVSVTQRAPDFVRPWTKRNSSKSHGSGVMIEGNRILTNAHVVRFASQIQVQRHGSSVRHVAHVVAVAPGIDLALIELEETAVSESIPAIAIDEKLPDLEQAVSAFGYPKGGDELSITEGVVSRIEMASYYQGTIGLRIQIDAALNPGNSGGPAVSDDKLVGIVFSKIKEADNIGYLIPVKEVRMFLDDVEDGSYDGKYQFLDFVSTIENKALRDWLGLDNDTTGVAVKKTYADQEESVLQKWDVITHIGPHNIDNRGYCRLHDGLRLRFQYHAPDLSVDGKVPMSVIRDGKQLELQVPTYRQRELVVPMMGNKYPPYFIWGPVVFTTAYQEFATNAGRSMITFMVNTENPLLRRLRDKPRFEGEEIVIIPNLLFPHRSMRGYGNVTMAVVEAIDDVPVRNLRHMVEMLRDARGEFVEIGLSGIAESLVFRRDQMEQVTEDVLADEGIRHRASPELRQVWNVASNRNSSAQKVAEPEKVETE